MYLLYFLTTSKYLAGVFISNWELFACSSLQLLIKTDAEILSIYRFLNIAIKSGRNRKLKFIPVSEHNSEGIMFEIKLSQRLRHGKISWNPIQCFTVLKLLYMNLTYLELKGRGVYRNLSNIYDETFCLS